MLTEVASARRTEDGRERRWYTTRSIDLYIWTSSSDHIERFQVCLKPKYSISAEIEEPEKVVTWSADEGVAYDIIQPTKRYTTPLLDAHAPFDLSAILEELKAESPDRSFKILDVVVTTLLKIKESEA